jgi:ATP-dependent Clp protease adaptor protein ClpS
VIQSLIEICDHDPIQAEQCAFITHHTGKCDIRKGSYESLNPLRESLLFRGLQVTID